MFIRFRETFHFTKLIPVENLSGLITNTISILIFTVRFYSKKTYSVFICFLTIVVHVATALGTPKSTPHKKQDERKASVLAV